MIFLFLQLDVISRNASISVLHTTPVSVCGRLCSCQYCCGVHANTINGLDLNVNIMGGYWWSIVFFSLFSRWYRKLFVLTTHVKGICPQGNNFFLVLKMKKENRE